MAHYIVSPFTVSVDMPFQEKNFAYLLNTLTGGECMLPKSLWQAIKDGDPSALGESYLKMLADFSFIVPEHFDGFAAFMAAHEKMADDFSFIGSHVTLTGRCLLHCLYCFLAGQAAVDMSAETALQMDRFYFEIIDRHAPRRVHDIFSGGEPTLNIGVAQKIAWRRHAHCNERGIPYSCTLKTNGVLLSNPSVFEAVCAMKAHGLRSLDVSISGPEEVHNFWRPAAKGMNSYQLTKSGLKAISPHVPVRIVLIIDLGSDSFERFFDPIDDFMSSGISIANVTVSGILPRLQDGTYRDSISEYDKLFPLHKVLEKKGFPVYREPPKMGCGLDSNSYFAFDPSGRIVACPALTPDRQRVYGHVSTGTDLAAKRTLMKRNFTAACRSCEILPLCSGSCRYEAEAAKNQFDDVYCMHDHIRKVLDQYLLRKAKTSLKDLEKEGRLP